VKTDKAEHAFQLRKKLREEWETLLLPVFEKAFNEIAGGDEILQIKKLSIRLTQEMIKNPSAELESTIYRQLMDQLSVYDHHQWQPAEPAKITRQQYQLDVLMHYLHTGNLPWDVTHLSAEAIRNSFQQIAAREADRIAVHLINKQPGTPFFYRLLQLLLQQPEIMAGCLQPLFPVEQLKDISAWIKAITQPTDHLHGTHEIIARAAELLVSLNESRAGKNDINKGNSLHLKYNNEPAKEISGPLEHLQEPIHTRKSILNPGLEKAENSELLPSGNSNPDLVASDGDILNGMVMPNAGLILIHPFLPALLETLGLLEKDKNIPVNLLPKAAAILYYLANGEEEPFEFELGLIKVLIGMHPMDALPISSGLISEAEKEECVNMLKSAILHWKALGNTSVAGIQQSFLSRRGLLTGGDEHWSLTLETKTYDLLLEQLPWSISIIKHPWMLKPIYTEWRTN
jgi:hypothetical protein